MSVNHPMSIIRSSHASRPGGSWIGWYTSLQGHDFLLRVPNDYINDRFNLTGLEMSVPNFNLTLDTILDPHFEGELWDQTMDTTHAESLYGLIHARYILTTPGIEAMCTKYERGEFGVCPRVFCKGQYCLPVGLTDELGQSHVKLYCPRCHDVFQPRSRSGMLDGAMFGTGFPHMFFLQLPHLRPSPPEEKYVGRLFGFQLHQSALYPSDSPDGRKNGYDESSSAASPKIAVTRPRRSMRKPFHF